MLSNSLSHIDSTSKKKRIVCLVPSITELLYDMNLEEEILGITKFCIYPKHFKKTKTIIGGTKKVSEEKIRNLKPDLIICNKEENTKEIVERMQQIAPVYLSEINFVNQNTQLFRDLGKLTHRNTAAENLVSKFHFQKSDFENFIAEQPIRKTAYYIWAKPWMAAAKNTYINSVLELLKLENMYGDLERYPVVEIKKFRLDGDAEYVLLPDEPYPFKDEHAFELGRFTHHAKVVFVDGSYFSWYGSRSIKAFKYFKEVLKSL